MVIDNNILAISKCMFQNRKDWIHVTDEQKKQFFFIFNRYFSKKYPKESQMLNLKEMDGVVGMDIWFHFMEGKPYPNWFWSKSEKAKQDSLLNEKEINLLMSRFNLKFEELDLLILYHLDEVKEELKYLKELEKK